MGGWVGGWKTDLQLLYSALLTRNLSWASSSVDHPVGGWAEEEEEEEEVVECAGEQEEREEVGEEEEWVGGRRRRSRSSSSERGWVEGGE